ncbi:unnamed protein product [Orchesella dallaii]|uniref:Cell cycle checkpoint control protein RAD9A n=1 Tax=Orchesella dallaii TaxID=48710 RepID=A0ABP1RL46_9HEXA
MKVIVGNAHLGTWCRAVHALTQVGDDEIHFDASDGILTLSTFNASMTNYATVLFFRNFFSSCQMNVTSDEPEKIAVPAKTILKPYRTLKVAKSYLSSEIKFNPTEDFITVTSEGKSHVSTTYKLCATESSSDVQFDCDPYAMKSFLKADAKVLSSCLSNFNHMKGLSELTLKIQGQRVMLKNTVTDMARKDGTVVTEYTLTSHDFIEFEVDADSIELAFGFREFKIFTSFAEQLKVPVTIYFQTPNDPVIVTVKTDTFEARLCMATRIRDPFDMAGTEASGNSVGSNGRISNVASQMPVPSRDVSVEVNRRVERGTLDDQRDDTEEPVPKRPRRTDFRLEPEPLINQDNEDDVMFVADLGMSENPVRDESESRTSERDVVIGGRVETLSSQSDAQNLMIRDEPENAVNPVPSIVPLVQQMEGRARSVGYLTLQAVVNAPPMTEAEYLKSLPGHDQVLCPDSDEEDAT